MAVAPAARAAAERMTTYESVAKLLTTACRCLVSARLEFGCFRDVEEADARYYFSTLEGLESLLIPAFHVDGFTPDQLLASHADFAAALSDDLSYVLKLSKSGSKRGEQGMPYFRSGRGASRTSHWTADCASFTVSVLVKALLLKRLKTNVLATVQATDLKKAVAANVDLLLACGSHDGRWAWLPKSRSGDPWATWSIVETLTDYLDYEKSQKEPLPRTKKIRRALSSAKEALVADLRCEVSQGAVEAWKDVCGRTTRVRTEPEVRAAYAFLHTMTSAALLGLHAEQAFLPLAVDLFRSVSAIKMQSVENKVSGPGKIPTIHDYSYHATLLRALTSIYVHMSPSDRSQLSAELPESAERSMRFQLDVVMKDYLKSGVWAGLWGYRRSYEIYYTERTIEALVSLCECLRELKPTDESWSIPGVSIKKPSRREIKREMDKVRREQRTKLGARGRT